MLVNWDQMDDMMRTISTHRITVTRAMETAYGWENKAYHKEQLQKIDETYNELLEKVAECEIGE